MSCLFCIEACRDVESCKVTSQSLVAIIAEIKVRHSAASGPRSWDCA